MQAFETLWHENCDASASWLFLLIIIRLYKQNYVVCVFNDLDKES